MRNDLEAYDATIRTAWTGAGSTPFIADAPLGDLERDRFAKAVRLQADDILFRQYPYLAVWALLRPLLTSYGAAGTEVYSHISGALGRDYDRDLARRRHLKYLYRQAARRIGLPVDIGATKPTALFFAALGPVCSQHDHLARSFVAMAVAKGPPAIEDTLSARRWQQVAVSALPEGLERLRVAIAFDQSAWCATRFDAWRRGEPPAGDNEAHLFAAYDAATRVSGRNRRDLVGPPQLVWSGHNLALEAEKSPAPQSLRFHSGGFPTAIVGGTRVQIPVPWPELFRWTYRAISSEFPAAPRRDEVLVFDADTGALAARLGPSDTLVETASAHQIVVANTAFNSSSFGHSRPAQDPSYQIAWMGIGDRIEFSSRPPVTIAAPHEAAMWIEGTVLGRSGSVPLYACDGRISLRLNPELGGACRFLRAMVDGHARYVELDVSDHGEAAVPFEALGLDRDGSPQPVRLEILAPGALGNLEARAELKLQAWIWPGLDTEAGKGDILPLPQNFLAARSAGLRGIDGRLQILHEAEIDAPILGLADGNAVREFRLSVRGDRLWHVRVGIGNRVRVPRGAALAFGHAQRHDTLHLRCDDGDADLVVLGKRLRHPFFERAGMDIPAGMLEPDPNGDDRIALIRKTDRIDLLARLVRVDDPARLSLESSDAGDLLELQPQHKVDAVRVVIERVDGTTDQGEHSLGYRPAGSRLPEGISAARSLDGQSDGPIRVRIDRRTGVAPGRLRLELRDQATDYFRPALDVDGAAIVVALDGHLGAPDIRSLTGLAKLLAYPVPEPLAGPYRDILQPHYARAFASVGATRLVGTVKPVLQLCRDDGAPPLHDLAGVAPWIFEAGLHAFNGLPADTWLAPLSTMAGTEAPARLPSLTSDDPLATWLDGIEDSGPPEALSGERLAHGLRALRHNLHDTDLRRLMRLGADASALRLICDVHVAEIECLRRFDHDGGGDPGAARILALIERFARAATQRDAQGLLDRLALRTGLPALDCGRILTLALRAGADLFAYFRTLWHHAAEADAGKTGRTR